MANVNRAPYLQKETKIIDKNVMPRPFLFNDIAIWNNHSRLQNISNYQHTEIVNHIHPIVCAFDRMFIGSYTTKFVVNPKPKQ